MSPEKGNKPTDEESWLDRFPGKSIVIVSDTETIAKLITTGIPPGWEIKTITQGNAAYLFLTKKDPPQT